MYYETLVNNGSIPGLGTDVQEVTEPPLPACTLASECADTDDDDIRDDNCVWSDCQAEFQLCDFTPLTQFADMGGAFGICPPDGFANIHDKNHALQCFSGTNPCDPINIDSGGAFGACPPDGFCNIHDANHALSAFAQTSTCSCPAGPAPVVATTVVGSAKVALRVRAEERSPQGMKSLCVSSSTPPHRCGVTKLDVQVTGGRSGRTGARAHTNRTS